MLARRAVSFKKTAVAPPAGIVFIGSDEATANRDTGGKSVTVTVPAGATFASIGFGSWQEAGCTPANVYNVSLDGITADRTANSTCNNSNGVSVFHVSGFGIGDVTLSWTQFRQNQGMQIGLMFWSGVDLADPIRSSAFNGDGSNVSTRRVDFSGTAQPGDVLAGFAVGDSIDMDRNGQTERVGPVSQGGTDARVVGADKPQGGAQGDDIEATGTWTALVGFVIKPSQ